MAYHSCRRGMARPCQQDPPRPPESRNGLVSHHSDTGIALQLQGLVRFLPRPLGVLASRAGPSAEATRSTERLRRLARGKCAGSDAWRDGVKLSRGWKERSSEQWPVDVGTFSREGRKGGIRLSNADGTLGGGGRESVGMALSKMAVEGTQAVILMQQSECT